jgi:predicted O-methyltransferase YrrM
VSTINRDLFFRLFGSGSAPGSRGEMYANIYDREVLLALVRTVRPATVVEFGVNRGLTARLILSQCPWVKRYVGVDAAPGFVPELPGQLPEVPKAGEAGCLVAGDPRFRLALFAGGTSFIDPVVAALPKKADFVYIDGDHSVSGVRRETALARAIVRPGGVIAWHDYGNRTVGVSTAIDELNRAEGDRICHVEGSWVAFEVRRGGV